MYKTGGEGKFYLYKNGGGEGEKDWSLITGGGGGYKTGGEGKFYPYKSGRGGGKCLRKSENLHP